MIWVGAVFSVTPHPEWSPLCSPKHTRIQTTAMTHHSNNSVRDHMKWVSGNLLISRITFMVLVCVCSQSSAIAFLPASSIAQSLADSLSLTPCADLWFVLLGWVAGLRGSAVQHGTDAGQQHARPEEDDVISGPGAEGRSWEPSVPLPAWPWPWASGPPWPPAPPQPHGPSLRGKLSTTGKRQAARAPHTWPGLCLDLHAEKFDRACEHWFLNFV